MRYGVTDRNDKLNQISVLFYACSQRDDITHTHTHTDTHTDTHTHTHARVPTYTRTHTHTHTRTHTHTHIHTHTHTHTHTTNAWIGADQYAEEKRWVFRTDVKEKSEDECLRERGWVSVTVLILLLLSFNSLRFIIPS